MQNENYKQMYELALEGNGQMMKGYSNFHNYSFFNQMYASWQFMGRDKKVQPIATYKKWQELGRQVKTGSKALELCVPNKWKNKETDEEGMYFAFKKMWFAYDDTEGNEVEFPQVDFDLDKCLETLGIEKVPFEMINGNTQGYAFSNKIAVNPLAQLPDKTLFHELGHILLGHTKSESAFVDSPDTPKNIMEVEAESVALCVSLALGMDENVKFCVGYIKSYLKNNTISVESIKKIFKVTDLILKTCRLSNA